MNRRRDRAIDRALPEAIDLLAVVVQSGLDFQVALQYYVQRGSPGPLRDEMSIVCQDIRFGASRPDAMRRFAERLPMPSIKELVRTVVRAFETGSGLAPLLLQQAENLRTRQMYEAEERASQAPLKLLFPLFVFIVPTIFVVLFGPLLLNISQGGLP